VFKVSALEPQFLVVGDGERARRIAYVSEPASKSPPLGLFWLSGFKSDMASTKVTALAEYARANGLGCTRFDYSGHGISDGRFVDGTIGAWLDQAVAAFTKIAAGPQIVVGSSMGGHIALLLLRKLMREAPADAARIKGLVLIAPAWDMTEALIWAGLPPEARRQVMEEGQFIRPSAYGDGYPITRALIEDGRNHLFEARPFDPGRPVRILHGRLDPDVPFAHSLELMKFLQGDHATLTEVPDGEHRLSRPQDLDKLFGLVGELLQRVHGARAC